VRLSDTIILHFNSSAESASAFSMAKTNGSDDEAGCCIFYGRTSGGDDEAGCCIFYGRTGLIFLNIDLTTLAQFFSHKNSFVGIWWGFFPFCISLIKR
jgi:hypothetical protein